MRIVSIPVVKNLVSEVAIKLNEPLMVEGQFGGGKTEGVTQRVEELNSSTALQALLGASCPYTGTMMVDVRLGQWESVDVRGFPGVHKATGLTVWHAPAVLPFVGNDNFPDDKIIVLFLDELTSAQPPVAAVAYQLINERKVGEHTLKPNVRIVAAGNRAEDKGVVNRMPMPLANRMTWVQIGISVDAWCDYAQSVGVPPVFIAFLNFKKDLLCNFDPKKADKTVATPRTWMKAVKYYTSDMSDDMKAIAMEGAIGQGPALEFMSFVNIWQKVLTIKQIMADPEGVPLPKEADMRYATAVSVSGSMTAKTMTPLYTFLKRMNPEFVVLALQLAIKRDNKLTGVPEFLDFSKRYRSVFSAV